jgi:hypothetical protein
MYRLIFPTREASRPPLLGDTQPVTIGRAPGCSLQLTDAGVRDHHATIERRPDGYYLRDHVGNRTVRVNDHAVSDRRLSSGDHIEIGAARLQFQIVHDLPGSRRAFDIWQALAGLVVVALVVGQLGFFGWIFAQPHPRNMKLDIVKGKQPKADPPPPAPAASAPDLPALVPATPAPPLPAPAPAPLHRQLRVLRVDRVDGAADFTIRLQIKAQARERELDLAAAQILLQCYTAGQKLLATHEVPLPAAWENFTTKLLTLRLPHPPAQCAGYVVRTYYRKQLQDVWASTPALVAGNP